MERHLRTAVQWLGLRADGDSRRLWPLWVANGVLIALGWRFFGFWGAVAGCGIVAVAAVFYPGKKETIAGESAPQPSDD